MYLAAVLDFLSSVPRGAAVLDAGCGGGDFAIGLADAGFTVFGSDMSPSGIAHSNALGVGTFVRASVYDELAVPFARSSFDAIVCVEVIEHLYSPKRFSERAMEALVPGGIIVITTPYWGYVRNVVMALTNRMDRALTPLWEGGHIKHFSRATLTTLMETAGFETVGFKGCGDGLRAVVPTFYNGMAMAFRKPQSVA